MHYSKNLACKLTSPVLQPPLSLHEIQPEDFNTRAGMIAAAS
jgi:hypothetical protein